MGHHKEVAGQKSNENMWRLAVIGRDKEKALSIRVMG
jgi:hypothetical protein